MTAGAPTIGIIGAGPVSRSLAHLLGHRYRVTVGTRHPELLRLQGLTDRVDVGPLREAAGSDVVVLAVPHRSAPSVVALLREQLAGKVLIDTMNAWALPAALTEGTWLSGRLPTTMVARAFSHIDPGTLVERGTAEPGRWAAGYAADDPRATAMAEQLIAATGFVPVRVGCLAESAPLDVGGILWPYMFTPDDMRATLAGHRAGNGG